VASTQILHQVLAVIAPWGPGQALLSFMATSLLRGISLNGEQQQRRASYDGNPAMS
jgi:hypothetical protein